MIKRPATSFTATAASASTERRGGANAWLELCLLSALALNGLFLVANWLFTQQWPDPKADGGSFNRFVAGAFVAGLALSLVHLTSRGSNSVRRLAFWFCACALGGSVWWFFRGAVVFAVAARPTM